MVRYSEEIRIQVAKEVLEGGLSENEAARKYGMSHVTVNEWVATYSKHGATGLLSKRTHRTFTGEQKQYIVEDMRENRLSHRAAAKKHDVPDRSIRKWERRYLNEGPEALYAERRGRPSVKAQTEDIVASTSSMDELIKENLRLRTELAYLKKLKALVQEKDALRTTTKLK